MRAFADQAMTHARELTHFHAQTLHFRDALRKALSLVNVARRNEWTVACDAELKQIQETLSVLASAKKKDAR